MSVWRDRAWEAAMAYAAHWGACSGPTGEGESEHWPAFYGLEGVLDEAEAALTAERARTAALVEALREVLSRDTLRAEGHEGPYYDCPRCDESNSGDTTYHASLEAWHEAAEIAQAALAEYEQEATV